MGDRNKSGFRAEPAIWGRETETVQMTRYRINQVKLDVGEDHEALADAIRRKLKKPGHK